MTNFCKYLLLILAGLATYVPARAQLCTTPGQTPVTAVLVCGTQSFRGSTPTYCGVTSVPTPCPGGFTYSNKNPNFFRMNCFSSGTLGFLIEPDEATADYSWQLFDITNYNPNDIFTNPSLFVACNWSSDPGTTGATIDGTNTTVCGGGGEPVFSKMPDILIGHTYLLMISNQSGSFLGYDLTFTGGTASITDDVEPHLDRARASCDGNEIVIRGNKKFQCASLAADGSDFTLPGAIITNALPGDCSSPLGTDSVILILSQPLPLGNYTLTVHNGTDGNTLMDVCNRSIPEGEQLPFTVTPVQPIAMDSLFVPPGCSPGYVDLVFPKGIRCASIAPDASDFLITGPQNLQTAVVAGSCSGGSLTTRIRLRFASPPATGGTYQVALVSGNDGNSLIDECGLELLPSPSLSFTVANPLTAAFSFSAPAGCRNDTVRFQHNGNNNTNYWEWNFGNGNTSNLQYPSFFFTSPGNHTVQLVVKNNVCTDTSRQTVRVRGDFRLDFSVSPYQCPGDTLDLVNRSSGPIDTWKWNMGDGNLFTDRDPVAYRYLSYGSDMYFTITLTGSNTTLGCSDTVKKTFKLLGNCLVAVPTAFTPNNDGKNDFLYPLNAARATDLEFRVYNRDGQLLFITRDWTNKWDGTFRGQALSTGVYAWILQFRDGHTGEWVRKKGTTLLLR